LVIAQDNIRHGVAITNEVDVPYAYWDILRQSTNGWLWQKKDGNNWEDYEKTIQRKDSKGRFTRIETQRWSDFENKWLIVRNNGYSFVENSQNELMKVIYGMKTNTRDLTYEYEYTYNNSKISSSKTYSKDNANGFPKFNSINEFYLYDTNGKKIKDSVIWTSPFQLWQRRYLYDINNNLISGITINNTTGSDTMFGNLYEYNPDNTLKVKRQIRNSISYIDKEEYYTYNINGKIKELTIIDRVNTAQTLTPRDRYKHYYENDERLVAVVWQRYSNNNWINLDSIAFNYLPNGNFDTAFIYKRITSSTYEWKKEYSERIIFDYSNYVGIATPHNNFELLVYPNPTSTVLTVSITPESDGNELLLLTDLIGKQIHTEVLNFTRGEKQNIQINMGTIPKGLYLLKVGVKTLKIIKE
jgi:hypothetical protein